MGNIITIEGSRESGKSTLARKITAHNKTITIAEYQLMDPFWTSMIKDGTEYVIIEDVKEYEITKEKFNQKTLSIYKRGLPEKEISMPSIILIKNSL